MKEEAGSESCLLGWAADDDTVTEDSALVLIGNPGFC